MAYQREARAMMNIDWEQVSKAEEKNSPGMAWRPCAADSQSPAPEELSKDCYGIDERKRAFHR
jgi:hypothetical protein